MYIFCNYGYSRILYANNKKQWQEFDWFFYSWISICSQIHSFWAWTTWRSICQHFLSDLAFLVNITRAVPEWSASAWTWHDMTLLTMVDKYKGMNIDRGRLLWCFWIIPFLVSILSNFPNWLIWTQSWKYLARQFTQFTITTKN